MSWIDYELSPRVSGAAGLTVHVSKDHGARISAALVHELRIGGTKQLGILIDPETGRVAFGKVGKRYPCRARGNGLLCNALAHAVREIVGKDVRQAFLAKLDPELPGCAVLDLRSNQRGQVVADLQSVADESLPLAEPPLAEPPLPMDPGPVAVDEEPEGLGLDPDWILLSEAASIANISVNGIRWAAEHGTIRSTKGPSTSKFHKGLAMYVSKADVTARWVFAPPTPAPPTPVVDPVVEAPKPVESEPKPVAEATKAAEHADAPPGRDPSTLKAEELLPIIVAIAEGRVRWIKDTYHLENESIRLLNDKWIREIMGYTKCKWPLDQQRFKEQLLPRLREKLS